MTNVSRLDPTSSTDRDYVWVYQKEVRAILTQARKSTGDFALPPSLVARLVRFHLKDGLGGRNVHFTDPDEVKKAIFMARRDATNPSRFTFTGEWECGTNRSTGGARNLSLPLQKRGFSLSSGMQFASYQEGSRLGIRGRIEGEFTLDTTMLRVARFRAFASAQAWGGGRPGLTMMPPSGNFPISFAFVEADDAQARGIPPSPAYDPGYTHAWFWMLPEEKNLPLVEPNLRITSILQANISTVEQTIGKPRSIGTKKERYYKVPGFVRIIIKPTTEGHIASVEFQFARSQVTDWRQSLLLVGINPAGAEEEETNQRTIIRFAAEIPKTPQGWDISWNSAGDSGNDSLVLVRAMPQ